MRHECHHCTGLSLHNGQGSRDVTWCTSHTTTLLHRMLAWLLTSSRPPHRATSTPTSSRTHSFSPAHLACCSTRARGCCAASSWVGISQCPTPEAAFQLVTLGRRPPNAVQPSATTASDVSPPSNPSSSSASVRRAAGGVHDDEEVCAGPQAGAHASPSAAYHQPSASVTDSRSAFASQAVGGADGDGYPARAAASSVGTVPRNTPSRERVPVEWRLPSAVLDQMPSLTSEPRRVPVIADGRCAVASVLLARGVIPGFHNAAEGRHTLDASDPGWESLTDTWTETEWVKQVPLYLRRDHQECDPVDAQAAAHVVLGVRAAAVPRDAFCLRTAAATNASSLVERHSSEQHKVRQNRHHN